MHAPAEGGEAGSVAVSRASSGASGRSERARSPKSKPVRSRASSNASVPAPRTQEEWESMVCEACGEGIDDDNAEEGIVRMSECFWHVGCFTCITCGRQVPLDQDNVLLVGTQPMCGDCTFNCTACNEVIVDEVIMCDQDPYHTECFCCSYCKQPIESNIFAKMPGTLACVACQDRVGERAPAAAPATRSPSLGNDVETLHSTRHSSNASEYSASSLPVDEPGREPIDLTGLYLEDSAWRRGSTATDTGSGSFELAYDRLSEMIQTEIVQAYYSMQQSRGNTPMHGLEERLASSPTRTDARRGSRTLPPPTLRKQLARRSDRLSQSSEARDPWNRPTSYTDSEIMRSLSMYDSEFDALLATPDISARVPPEGHEGRLSRASMEVVDQIAHELAHVHDDDNDDDDTPESPTVTRPRDGPWRKEAGDESVLPDAPAPLSEQASLEMERRIALAELLAIDDAAAPPGANVGEKTSIRSRVELVLHSLMAHLDTVKQEYAQEVQALAAQQQVLRQEIRPMMQLRAALHQENQRLAQRADELGAQVAQLEARSLHAHVEKPLPKAQEANGGVQVTLSREASGASAASRLDASLPPLPVPRKFRWIKPRLLSNHELTTLGETLMQPAFEVKRSAASVISPPVPPKNLLAVPSTEPVQTHMHVFQPANVLRPSARCFVCSRNLWGQQEMRCTQCQQVCHTTCVAHVSSTCSATNTPPARSPSGSPHMHKRSLSSSGASMVGRALQEQVQIEGTLVPRLVDWCVMAVEKNGMGDEGLYRKSGGSQQQRLILQLFDSGQSFDLCDVHQFNDIGALTSVLKHYLRELPEPLIPSDTHDRFLEFGERAASTQPDAAVPAMRRLLKRLPDSHRATLGRLCLHLKRVDQHAATTRMTSRNLGLVFGRTWTY